MLYFVTVGFQFGWGNKLRFVNINITRFYLVLSQQEKVFCT